MTRRVLYDLQVFVEQAHGGVSRYFRELGTAVERRGSWQPTLPPGVHVAMVGLRATGPLLRIPTRGRAFRLMRSVNRLSSRVTAPWISSQIAVVHPTWYHRPSIEVWKSKPVVVTIHDLIPEAWPSVTTPTQLADRAWAITRANAILCASRATAQDLVERFPEVADRIVVAYPGVSPLPMPPQDHGQDRPYFVYVGKRGAYKDFQTLLRAMAQLRHPLVVIGGGAPGEGTSRYIQESGLDRLITFETSPDDATLAKILAGATALVSTSRKEGFGMPPLEALALGTPIILSDIAVYREVYGDWAEFFEPGNHESLAAAMEGAIAKTRSTPSLQELQARYSWNEAAARAEHAYEMAAR